MTIKVSSGISVEDAIRRFIEENLSFADNGLPLRDDDSFIDNSIVDSTGILELELFVEEAFGIQVRDDEVLPENFDSISRLASYVRRKQQAAP